MQGRDGTLKDFAIPPQVTPADVERLLAVLARGARRIERVELSSGAVWIKRYGRKRALVGMRAQNALARLFRQPFLRASPRLAPSAMVGREIRRIALFRERGLPVPHVLYRSAGAVVLSDAGSTVSMRLAALRTSDLVAHEDLLVACAADLGALHGKGLCHGRPHPRDFFLENGRIGFMDFEEEPEAVMPLAMAQARDLWLLFLQLTQRALEGDATLDRAFAAWETAAPAAARRELGALVGFLGKFLSLTRLIGRMHMGSDLQRFLAATRYLSRVCEIPRPAGASKAGKDD